MQAASLFCEFIQKKSTQKIRSRLSIDCCVAARRPCPCLPASAALRYSALTPRSIRTTKYTLLTFLPRNLFEQFHRVANIYFLFIVILNWIPVVRRRGRSRARSHPAQITVFLKEISMIPLVFVLSVGPSR